MISEKTIQICGKDVKMRYCAAAETGYEQMSGQSSEIFIPEVEKDDDGNIKNVITHAKAEDYIKLGLAAIFAAYSRKDEDAPIKAEEILYDAEPGEVQNLINTVMELRAKWYEVSPVVAEKSDMQEATDEAENDDKPKNA